MLVDKDVIAGPLVQLVECVSPTSTDVDGYKMRSWVRAPGGPVNFWDRTSNELL